MCHSPNLLREIEEERFQLELEREEEKNKAIVNDKNEEKRKISLINNEEISENENIIEKKLSIPPLFPHLSSSSSDLPSSSSPQFDSSYSSSTKNPSHSHYHTSSSSSSDPSLSEDIPLFEHFLIVGIPEQNLKEYLINFHEKTSLTSTTSSLSSSSLPLPLSNSASSSSISSPSNSSSTPSSAAASLLLKHGAEGNGSINRSGGNDVTISSRLKKTFSSFFSSSASSSSSTSNSAASSSISINDSNSLPPISSSSSNHVPLTSQKEFDEFFSNFNDDDDEDIEKEKAKDKLNDKDKENLLSPSILYHYPSNGPPPPLEVTSFIQPNGVSLSLFTKEKKQKIEETVTYINTLYKQANEFHNNHNDNENEDLSVAKLLSSLSSQISKVHIFQLNSDSSSSSNTSSSTLTPLFGVCLTYPTTVSIPLPSSSSTDTSSSFITYETNLTLTFLTRIPCLSFFYTILKNILNVEIGKGFFGYLPWNGSFSILEEYLLSIINNINIKNYNKQIFYYNKNKINLFSPGLIYYNKEEEKKNKERKKDKINISSIKLWTSPLQLMLPLIFSRLNLSKYDKDLKKLEALNEIINSKSFSSSSSSSSLPVDPSLSTSTSQSHPTLSSSSSLSPSTVYPWECEDIINDISFPALLSKLLPSLIQNSTSSSSSSQLSPIASSSSSSSNTNTNINTTRPSMSPRLSGNFKQNFSHNLINSSSAILIPLETEEESHPPPLLLPTSSSTSPSTTTTSTITPLQDHKENDKKKIKEKDFNSDFAFGILFCISVLLCEHKVVVLSKEKYFPSFSSLSLSSSLSSFSFSSLPSLDTLKSSLSSYSNSPSFSSHSLPLASSIVSCLTRLLSPLRWEGVTLPLLPFQLFDLLQAPVPSLLGISVPEQDFSMVLSSPYLPQSSISNTNLFDSFNDFSVFPHPSSILLNKIVCIKNPSTFDVAKTIFRGVR